MSLQTPQQLARPLARRTMNLPPLHDVGVDDLSSTIPSGVLEAAAEALERGETHYTDRPGIIELRQLVAAHLTNRYQIAITPKDITITCGATEARFVAVKLLAKAGAVVAALSSEERVQGAVQLAAATLTTTLEPAASVFYATPHIRYAAYGDWMQSAIDLKAWVIWDLSEGEGSGNFHPAQNADLAPRVVTIGGLDAELPGWRVGWLAGSEAAEKLRALKQSMTICATSVSQWAAAELLSAKGGG